MFFNYISTATIPPTHLSPFNLKLESTPPAWQPEKSLIFRRGGRTERQIPTCRDFFRVVRFDDKITAFF